MVTRKAVLVGAGGFAREWGKLLVAHPDVELVGWISRRAEPAAEAARAVGAEAYSRVRICARP